MSIFPKPTGQYVVGTKIFTVNIGSREILERHTQDVRRVSCRIWYPANSEDIKNRKRAEYITRELAQILRQNYDKITEKGDNYSECYVDAAYASGRFPLVIFHHGYGGFKEQNSCLCIELASHGYVVLSIGHPYEAMITEYDDGTIMRINTLNINQKPNRISAS